jgi:hypothetical protein
LKYGCRHVKADIIPTSADELMHPEILANRIIQLGGTLVMEWDKLIATA